MYPSGYNVLFLLKVITFMKKVLRWLFRILFPDLIDQYKRDLHQEFRAYQTKLRQRNEVIELKRYIGEPVICIDRSTCDLMIGLALGYKKTRKETDADSEVFTLTIHDYLTDREYQVDGIVFIYTEDRLKLLAEMSQNLRYKLFINTREKRDLLDTQVLSGVLRLVQERLLRSGFVNYMN